MRYFLLIWNKNEDRLDYVFQNGQNPHPPTPPRVFNCPKSPQDLGLNVDTLNTSNSLIPFFLSFQRWHFPLRKVRLQYSWPKHMTHRFFSHPYMSTAFHSSFDGIYFSHLYSKSSHYTQVSSRAKHNWICFLAYKKFHNTYFLKTFFKHCIDLS